MRVLVYRRTHRGDPDNINREFGYWDCMGQVRDWQYDAVIGIGGVKPWPGDEAIQKRLTWVGIGRVQDGQQHRRAATGQDMKRMRAENKEFAGFRGSIVSFETFVLWDENCPSIEKHYSALFNYMFSQGKIPHAAIFDLSCNDENDSNIKQDLQKILDLAKETYQSGGSNHPISPQPPCRGGCQC